MAANLKQGFGEQYWTEQNLPKEAYTPSFPRQPLLDRIIVREIPIEEIYQQSEVAIPLDNTAIKDRSDRGEVVAVGDCVPIGGVILPMPVAVGDVVFFDEFCMCDPVFLNPADKRRSDLPKYWQLRVGDLKGVQRA
jgi:co-chaperonin GroES (HSP10)